jgi:hypothetical protein
MERSGPEFVRNHFDVVPVRTNDKCGRVVRAVVRAQTRRVIVLAARLQSRAMGRLNLAAVLGRERQVKRRRLLLGLVQAQRSLTLGAELGTVRRQPLRDCSYAGRFECLEEERLVRGIVVDSEFDAVKQEFCCSVRACACQARPPLFGFCFFDADLMTMRVERVRGKVTPEFFFAARNSAWISL